MNETGWLIETGAQTWWDGRKTDVLDACFTKDANEAIRFARFEDAEIARCWLLEPIANLLRSTEHVWAAHPAPSVPPPLPGDHFLMAYASKDGKVTGIDHDTNASWQDVLTAHIALRDWLNERIANQRSCPRSPPSGHIHALVPPNPAPPLPGEVGGTFGNALDHACCLAIGFGTGRDDVRAEYTAAKAKVLGLFTAQAAELERVREESMSWRRVAEQCKTEATTAEAALASAKAEVERRNEALRELANAARSACDARQHTDLISALVEAGRLSLLEPSEEPR